MKQYNFTVLVEKDEDGGYVAHVPELLGCHTEGDTITELLANIKEAVSLCLEVGEKDNIQVFNPRYVETHRIEMVV